MNREVYKHILGTYGRNPGQWFGFISELIRTLLNRVFITVLMAQTAANIASGHIEDAKLMTLYFLLAYVAGLTIGTIGELVAIRSENKQYDTLLMSFYRKLTSKDMSFYRDNQTGYLASVFRQYLDGTMLLVRFLRSEVIKVVVSLTVPAAVLLFADLKVGLVAVVILVVQLFYVVWSSAKAHKYRKMSHEIYRKVTGEVADEITNIVAFKSAGVEKEAHSKIARLALKRKSLRFGSGGKLQPCLIFHGALLLPWG